MLTCSVREQEEEEEEEEEEVEEVEEEVKVVTWPALLWEFFADKRLTAVEAGL